MHGVITLQRGFSEDMRTVAAELYDEAFGAKLSVAIPDSTLRLEIIKEAFIPGLSFVALWDEQLVGIIGFKTKTGSFTGGIQFKDLLKRLGLVGALRAMVVFLLYEHRVTSRQMLVDGICVSSQMQGRGIGGALLHCLIEFAQGQNYHSLVLDVVEMNLGARRLYERVGFVATGTRRFGYLGWLLGFRATIVMEYTIDSS